MNTGFPLETILMRDSRKALKKTKAKLNHEARSKVPIIYEHDTPIQNIKGIYEEQNQNTVFFMVDKRINNQRIRKRFDKLNAAIDYLNFLSSENTEKK